MNVPDRAENQNWPLVSVLFITYKRFELLEVAVRSFVEKIDYPNTEIIIADDGSAPDVQEKIRNLPFQKQALLPSVNRGLGANINQGLAACKGDYILMIQDDWASEGPADAIRNSVRLMQAHPEIGFVHYTMGLEPRESTVRIDGFGPPAYLYPATIEHRAYPTVYSDQPHLRSRAMNDFMGPYLEHRDMHQCERDYERRWEEQTRFEAAMYPEYSLKLFTNAGIGRSLREVSFRYRLDRALAPIAAPLKRFPGLFNFARNARQSLLRVFKAKL